ncbi:hypothetical protein HMPREF3226_00278 [Prevotella corporis]|uniref:Uncharacterized protein n=1 Tax=Prevotella corporis TaxID=28128 RepID=A0A133QLT7_9BACT|nr:hypothetical protein HMPREF3226_00278 [Prevotella corporis]
MTTGSTVMTRKNYPKGRQRNSIEEEELPKGTRKKELRDKE